MLLCSAAIVACRLCAEDSNVMLCVGIAGIATQLLDEELKLNLLVDRRSSSSALLACSTMYVHARGYPEPLTAFLSYASFSSATSQPRCIDGLLGFRPAHVDAVHAG